MVFSFWIQFVLFAFFLYSWAILGNIYLVWFDYNCPVLFYTSFVSLCVTIVFIPFLCRGWWWCWWPGWRCPFPPCVPCSPVILVVHKVCVWLSRARVTYDILFGPLPSLVCPHHQASALNSLFYILYGCCIVLIRFNNKVYTELNLWTTSHAFWVELICVPLDQLTELNLWVKVPRWCC